MSRIARTTSGGTRPSSAASTMATRNTAIAPRYGRANDHARRSVRRERSPPRAGWRRVDAASSGSAAWFEATKPTRRKPPVPLRHMPSRPATPPSPLASSRRVPARRPVACSRGADVRTEEATQIGPPPTEDAEATVPSDPSDVTDDTVPTDDDRTDSTVEAEDTPTPTGAIDWQQFDDQLDTGAARGPDRLRRPGRRHVRAVPRAPPRDRPGRPDRHAARQPRRAGLRRDRRSPPGPSSATTRSCWSASTSSAGIRGAPATRRRRSTASTTTTSTSPAPTSRPTTTPSASRSSISPRTSRTSA